MYSPDGKLIATAGEDKLVHLWDASTGKEVAALQGHGEYVWSATFSPDGTRLATASLDQTARIWNVARRKTTAILRSTGRVSAVAFLPDGKRIITGAQDGVHLWDVATGAPLRDLHGQNVFLDDVALSPDGGEFALVDVDDPSVRLYDTATFAPLGFLRGHADRVYSVRFSPDGRQLVSTSADKTARVWDLPPRRSCQEILDEAGRAALPQLTAAQRAEEFLGERSAPPLFNTFGSAGACR